MVWNPARCIPQASSLKPLRCLAAQLGTRGQAEEGVRAVLSLSCTVLLYLVTWLISFSVCFLNIYFIYWKVAWSIEREHTEKAIYQLLIHSLYGHKSRGWAKLQFRNPEFHPNFPRGLSLSQQYHYAILEHCWESWLFHFWSTSLRRYLGKEQKTIHIFRSLLSTREIWMKFWVSPAWTDLSGLPALLWTFLCAHTAS